MCHHLPPASAFATSLWEIHVINSLVVDKYGPDMRHAHLIFCPKGRLYGQRLNNCFFFNRDAWCRLLLHVWNHIQKILQRPCRDILKAMYMIWENGRGPKCLWVWRSFPTHGWLVHVWWADVWMWNANFCWLGYMGMVWLALCYINFCT